MVGVLYLFSVVGFCLVCYWYIKNENMGFFHKTQGLFQMNDEIEIYRNKRALQNEVERKRAERLGRVYTPPPEEVFEEPLMPGQKRGKQAAPAKTETAAPQKGGKKGAPQRPVKTSK